ncbi:transposase (plasmid) [Cylindrospermum sp. NIES-4074]|nr:transposase [Cylindrospermum sp. NIES-4074]
MIDLSFSTIIRSNLCTTWNIRRVSPLQGLDRFFSSLVSKPILGLSFFTLSLVSVEQRHSFPIQVEQVIKSDVEKGSPSPNREIKPQEKRQRGRPKGSKNKNKTQVTLTSELLRIQKMINSLFQLLGNFIPLTYLVLDGHFGNNNALQMARLVNLHIISKLRHHICCQSWVRTGGRIDSKNLLSFFR